MDDHIEMVLSRIAKIKHEADVRNDPEQAHAGEDELWYDVLKLISEGKVEDPIEVSRVAVTTRDLDFPRWYA